MRDKESFLKIVRNKISRFERLSKTYKFLYFFMKIFTVVIAGIAIPGILLALEFEKSGWVIGTASVFVAIFAGVDGILNFRLQWRTFEVVKDNLSDQMHKFIFSGSDYENLSEQQAFSKFVDIVLNLEKQTRTEILDLLTRVDYQNPITQNSVTVD